MRSILLLASLLYVARAENRCFNAQGIAITDSSFVPCNSTATVSACCASNKGNGDICIQGGLCYAQQGSYSGYIYGNGCTDSSFSDTSCPYACPMAKKNGWKAYNVLPCALDTWCCREASDRTNCCNSSNIIDTDQTTYLGRFINNAIPGTSTTSGDSNSTDAATTATVTSTITASSSSDSDSSNTTTVVGAAVGAVLGVACLIALVGLIWMMRKVKSLKREMQSLRSQESYPNAPMIQQPYNPPRNEAPTAQTYEADWNNGRYEIDGTGK